MSPLRVCTAIILVVAITVPALGSLDDFLFGAFCNRPDIDKLISICYTPSPVASTVQAGADSPAFSAAARGQFYGSSDGSTAKNSTLFIAAVKSQTSVKCTFAKENKQGNFIKLTKVNGEKAETTAIGATPPSADLTVSLIAAEGMAIQANYTKSFTCTWVPAM